MKYYMAGIKGAGMSALALLLSDLGYEVVGYDDAKDHRFTEDKLLERGIKIYSEKNDELDDETVVIYSPALKLDEHPELIRAQARRLKIYEYQEMLGRLTKKFESICISGCHGKTTTTSMLSHIMTDLGGCNYIIGDGRGHGDRNSNKFILESCEYRRHFLEYDPEYVVITNIEMDHTDYYKSMDDMILAYEEFANKADKMVIACGDDPYTHSLNVNPQIYYYGLNEDNDIQARDVEYRNDGTSFDVFVEDEYYGHFDLPLYGKHMLLNALAVIAICHYERLDAREVAKSLKTFKGAERRFKETFVGNNVLVDDYAHHPTEVKVTIKAARQKYPDKKVIAVFKAHTFSRVEEFADEFAEALNLADKAYVMDINYDRENPEDYPGVSAYTIINKLDNGDYIEQGMAEKLVEYDNAVILFMSSKEIYLLEDEYKKLLEKKETNK
ncbi:MAG: UDP-N-acetylmuramate--L-alanine ligase [Bacilli bacterium]|nr:UDP-N-acetylmuramate--L-alanine ligase [Bacilli bacterium]